MWTLGNLIVSEISLSIFFLMQKYQHFLHEHLQKVIYEGRNGS
jgi:hypothetical protein